MLNYLENFQDQFNAIYILIMMVNAFVHIVFAGAVAKDAGRIAKDGHPTVLVSGLTWSFATLVGGVFVAAVYWVLHHAKFSR